MSRRARSLASVAILALFIISLALSRAFPWLTYVWSVGLVLVIVAFSLNYLSDIFLSGDDPKTVRGYPRWFIKFAMDKDDDDEAKSQQ